jgi:hypothetical protein
MALHKPEHRTVKYWVLWLPLTVGFLLVLPIGLLTVGRKTGTWLRRWEDYIDDPIDYLKEKVHGAPVPFGYEINISFLMMNRETSWDVLRKRGTYPNSDPLD